jgi:hypothetical protein
VFEFEIVITVSGDAVAIRTSSGMSFCFKVWSADREVKKFVMSSGAVKDLIRKASMKLNWPPDASYRLVLEKDGTDIDEDEVLRRCDRNEALLLLADNENWTAPDSSELGVIRQPARKPVVYDYQVAERHLPGSKEHTELRKLELRQKHEYRLKKLDAESQTSQLKLKQEHEYNLQKLVAESHDLEVKCQQQKHLVTKYVELKISDNDVQRNERMIHFCCQPWEEPPPLWEIEWLP